jgi:hypothetical protein
MNAQRRKALAEIKDRLDDLATAVQGVLDDEQLALDNMPEALQSGDKGSNAQAAIDAMMEALDSIEGAAANLDDAMGGGQ